MNQNPTIDLVNNNKYTKFGLILSIHSQDIEQKPNYAGMDRETDGQGESSIAPLFQSGAIKKRSPLLLPGPSTFPPFC